VRHSLRGELAAVVGLYSVYEATRGLVAGGTDTALRHAQVLSLERSLHLFVKRDVQRAAGHVPRLMGTLGFAYLMLHLALTRGLLFWLHRRRSDAYPFIGTTLLLARSR